MRPTVVKVGGGLCAVPGALDAVCAALGVAARPLLVLPGGGPFADAVRAFDRRFGLSASAAHWMAVLAMDQYAHVLAERIPEATLVESQAGAADALRNGRVAVLAPSQWLRAADVLPHTWDVTSDSIAAFVAGAVDAARLVLIKPAADAPDPVDPYFAIALPADLPYEIIGWDEPIALSRLLTGP